MGPMYTLNSATLVNKGLELIETQPQHMRKLIHKHLADGAYRTLEAVPAP